jgi:hypothetical protein
MTLAGSFSAMLADMSGVEHLKWAGVTIAFGILFAVWWLPLDDLLVRRNIAPELQRNWAFAIVFLPVIGGAAFMIFGPKSTDEFKPHEWPPSWANPKLKILNNLYYIMAIVVVFGSFFAAIFFLLFMNLYTRENAGTMVVMNGRTLKNLVIQAVRLIGHRATKVLMQCVIIVQNIPTKHLLPCG